MKVKDVMTKHVAVLPPHAPISEIARLMRDEDVGSIPITWDDRLIGMVTDRDIVLRALADHPDPRALVARDVMSSKVFYCTEDQTMDEVLEQMGGEQIRRLPVLDSHHRLSGVVSLGDASQAVSKKAGGALKEISHPTAEPVAPPVAH